MINDSLHGYRTDWQSIRTCCLDISMYNRYQENLYLAGLCKWVNTRFEKCLVNIGDTLHRHNLRHKYTGMEEAHKAARSLGDQWLHKNMSYLRLLDIPYEIIRSDDWLNDPELEPVHEALWSYYYEDKPFQTAIKQDIETFVERRQDLPPSFVRTASLSYLLEETAADILLGQRGGVAHLYPAGRHACYGHLVKYRDSLPDILKGLENSAFKRISPAKLSIKAAELSQLQEINENRAKA